jgi:putative glutathione S-transferase
MGLLLNGAWSRDDRISQDAQGRFLRAQTQFRNWVTADGAPGPTGAGGFKAEAGRYHLYVSLACPWAHRTLLFRKLKGLEEAIGLSVVHWRMLEDGWTFEDGPGVIADPVLHARFLHQLYSAALPDYSGRVNVPVLWDKEKATIVNNESSEIIRMFNSAFDRVGARGDDYYPAALRPEIDALNERIYANVNNGVYKAGFAASQDAYEEAARALFASLDWLEEHLAMHQWLCGDQLTEADWRLFPTLIRFDAVYVGLFKCNVRRIADYKNLSRYLRALYAQPGVAGTVNFQHIKGHYYESLRQLNPRGIVPLGPELDLVEDPGTVVA